MKNILITGANGLVGQKLVRTFSKHSVTATGYRSEPRFPDKNSRYIPLDITDSSACKELITRISPDVIINAAAYTNVDGCETERETCWRVNVKGVENLAVAARKCMAQLVHISTDYIFDGDNGPYSEDAHPSPLGYYGKAKLASENTVRMAGIPYAIIRTNVVYGTGNGVKNNFFLWVYNQLKEGKPVRIVTDQYNNPTLADDLAEGIKLLVEQSAYGVYHLSGEDYINRFDFAKVVGEVFGFPTDQISPILTSDLQQKSPRPLKGGLSIELAKKELDYSPRTLREAFEFLKIELSH
ncbi:MAG: dTDP-4-dehydrorhamnose reductase [Calditrichia bacterium]